MPFLSYWFWPNPGGWHYEDPKVLALMAVLAGLIVLSFILRAWRRKLKNPVTSKLSRSWATAALTFGIIGLFLVVCRVESIQFVAMRFVWVLWLLSLGLYAAFQVLQFRRRHYTVLARTAVIDEREKYLPRSKR